MRIQATRNALIGRIAQVALIALCLFNPQVRAQQEVSFVFHTISWGMVRDQTARFNVFNSNEPSESGRPRIISIQVTMFDASGAEIARSDDIAIPPGEFRSVDIKFDDLHITGGPRVQTRAQIRYRSFQIIDRTQLQVWPTSIELIDDLTGGTTQLLPQKPKEIVVVGSRIPASGPHVVDLPIIVYSGRSLVGLTDGQTLRVNAVNPGNPADPRPESARLVRARVSLYDSNGTLLARSTEATIAPRQFHSFDFDRADIPEPGEQVGRRLEVLVHLEAAVTDLFTFTQDPRSTGLLLPSFELIGGTGKTAAVWVTTGFFEVTEPRQP